MTTPAIANRCHVSITGLELKSILSYPAFWYYVVPASNQVQSAPGNMHSKTTTINGIQHTMTVWKDKKSMLQYMRSGAHLEALKASRSLGCYAKVYGYECDQDQVPSSWEEIRQIWDENGRVVFGQPKAGDKLMPTAAGGSSTGGCPFHPPPQSTQ